ncbi:MAG: peptidoglycan bridge formation glycyltransferase FemA/FemB family protein [Elusimicrobia bacterium]|nr:peptidoglycan bridge formation glycyltransferase FemA/FemB family protein [Elusimicrobiota bacterium]
MPANDSDQAWDDALALMPDHNIYQSTAWARHKLARGWRLRRALSYDNGRPAAMVQALYKRFPGGCVLWSRGGPAGEPALWGSDMRKTLTQGLGLCYLRVCSYRELSPEQAGTLEENGWRRPRHPFNRALTFQYDLTRGQDEQWAAFTENWRHNLRRGQKRCGEAKFWENPRAGELLSVYRRMEQWKGIKKHYGADELDSLLGILKRQVILVRADDADGQPIALRACAVQGDKAWDLLAAASEAGRKNYASYALFWNLLERCKRLGVRSYDMGGADPALARGVFDFKKGSGARPVEYLGEWDWSTLGLARRGFGLGLKALGVGEA